MNKKKMYHSPAVPPFHTRKSSFSLTLILSLFVLASSSASAQDFVQLLKDVYSGATGSLPEEFVSYDGKFYFAADGGTYGQELWVSDGTPAGTTLLKDINTGAGSSSPSDFAVFNSKLYFAAEDGLNGRELWISDGTASGTVLFKDINTGTGTGSSLSDLIAFNGKLYFAADDGANGKELWVSDGTTAGTVLLEDINDSGSSSPADLTISGNRLYFQANNGSTGAEPWVLQPPSACEYPLDATLTQVAPWGPALLNGSPTVDALVDVSGTTSQLLDFYPEADSDGFQAMAMKSEMADTYPPSGELGDVLLPASGMIGYQVNLNQFFNPTGSSASSTGMEVIFASGTPTSNIGISVGNHYNASGTRWAYVRLMENGTIISNIPLYVGSDIGTSAKVGISIDRTNKKVYWSLDGGTPQVFKDSGGTDFVYGYNGTHGFFFVNANTGGQDLTGDSILSDTNSSTLITCASAMDQQFEADAVDIGGNEI